VSFVDKAKQAASSAARLTRRGAKRGKLELDAKRLQMRVNGEKDKIGHALYPALAGGSLTVDNADVTAALASIKELEAELAAKQAEIAAMGKDAAATPEDSSGPTPE
jgi:hypothetical protein